MMRESNKWRGRGHNMGFSCATSLFLCCFTVLTPPEATNTGPGFNRGSGGGARGRDFEERIGIFAYRGWSFPIAHDVCLAVRACSSGFPAGRVVKTKGWCCAR